MTINENSQGLLWFQYHEKNAAINDVRKHESCHIGLMEIFNNGVYVQRERKLRCKKMSKRSDKTCSSHTYVCKLPTNYPLVAYLFLQHPLQHPVPGIRTEIRVPIFLTVLFQFSSSIYFWVVIAHVIWYRIWILSLKVSPDLDQEPNTSILPDLIFLIV